MSGFKVDGFKIVLTLGLFLLVVGYLLTANTGTTSLLFPRYQIVAGGW